MKNREIEIQEYANATVAKFNNRRVSVVHHKNNESDDGFVIVFKRLSDTLPDAINKIIGGKISLVGVPISRDAAMALYQCLQIELGKSETVTYTKTEKP